LLWFKRKSSKQSQWQKTAELERERLKNVIENVPMILWAVDAHGVFTLSEGKALAQFHSKPGEVVGKLHSEVHRERPHLVANLKKALNGEAFITEVAIDNYWMETTYRPIINKKGTVEGVVGISVDITERKRSQEAVKESEKRHRLATKATKDIVWDWDLMSDEVIWGEALHAEFLYPKSFEQTNSAWWLENIHPDDRTAIHLSIVQCLENKLEHWSGEYRFRKFDGTYANVLDRGFIIYDSSGQPVRMIGAIQDTTERKKYVASLQQSENYFRELVDAAPAMIWIVDENFKCTYLSKSWYEFIGSQAHEDCHIAWLEYVHPEDQELTTLKFKDACHLRKAFRATYRLKNKNGFYRWVLDSGLPRFDKEGNFQGYMGSIIDIHEGKLAEEAVRQSQERFERVTNATNLGVWYCDLPSNFLSWNPKCKEHFWLSAEENVNSEIFLQRLHPDDRNRVLDACHQSIFNGVPYNIEYRTTSPHNPSQFKWIRAVGWTDYNHEGKAIRFDGITLDITIEKQLKDEYLRTFDKKSIDALAVFLGMRYKGFQLVYSYDANLSYLTRFNTGSHEISFSYRYPLRKKEVRGYFYHNPRFN
jgi:PAS domain S-box-containing protein